MVARLACGVQVVSGMDCHPEDIDAFSRAMTRRLEHPKPVRRLAESLFDPEQTARRFLNAVEAVHAYA